MKSRITLLALVILACFVTVCFGQQAATPGAGSSGNPDSMQAQTTSVRFSAPTSATSSLAKLTPYRPALRFFQWPPRLTSETIRFVLPNRR